MQSQNDIVNQLMVRLKTAIEELKTTGNSDALNEVRAFVDNAADKLKVNGNNDNINELMDRYNEKLDDIEVDVMLQRDPEMLKSISAMSSSIHKKTYENLKDTLGAVKTLQTLECEFLAIAIKEELNNEKKEELSDRHEKLLFNSCVHINPIIIDNLFAKYLQKTKNVFDLNSWNLHGPADPREPQSPLQHMLGLYLTCIDQIPKDIDIPAGSEIVPISITINLLAPKEAIQTDLVIVEKAILACRNELKQTRPELFMPESKKTEVSKTRTSKIELQEMNECLSILKKSLATGKTTSELYGHQPPKEVILEHYNLPKESLVAGNKKHSEYESCRATSRKKLDKALMYFNSVKDNCFYK